MSPIWSFPMSTMDERETGVRNAPKPDGPSAVVDRTIASNPARISRVQEKQALHDLNNRLALYIARGQYLEAENARLTQELHSHEEVSAREVGRIKSLFEPELDVLRTALDHEAQEKSRLEVENRHKNLEEDELKAKLDGSSKELKEATPFIARFNELNAKYGKLLTDHTNLKEVNKKLNKELAAEKKTVSDYQQKLKDNILLKVETGNKLQSLKDKFMFKEQVHKQQLSDAKTSRYTEFTVKVDRELKNKYESKFQNKLQLLQQRAEEDLRQNEKALSDLYESKCLKLENQLQREKSAMEVAQENISTSNTRINKLSSQINDLLASNNEYLIKINGLELLKENEKTKYLAKIQGLHQQLTAMQDDMSQKVQDYENLMDIKVALDMEISAYQKLLESEEKRLSITPNTSVVGSPRRKKRKESPQGETEHEFPNTITASATGDIEISEVCPDGHFVKLFNKGPKEIALSGFELLRSTVGKNVSTVHKFQSSVKLGPGNQLTMWSSTASNQIHERSTGSIVMDTQAWVVGDLMNTILLNSMGKEVATHELKKGKFIRQSGDPQTYGGCFIM